MTLEYCFFFAVEEEQYNDVGFIGMALWIGCICRSMAIYLHIPLCISHVGVFTVGFIISFLNFHDYINFKMINSLASYNEHAFCMLIIPVILINLSLRIDFYLYQRKPLQVILFKMISISFNTDSKICYFPVVRLLNYFEQRYSSSRYAEFVLDPLC